jgi:hypothetical protein
LKIFAIYCYIVKLAPLFVLSNTSFSKVGIAKKISYGIELFNSLVRSRKAKVVLLG